MSNLSVSFITTPLGRLVAAANNTALLVLAFTDQPNIEHRIAKKFKININEQNLITPNPILEALSAQLNDYFSGKLGQFTVPIEPSGTPFQLAAWQALRTIPYGKTTSYQQQAAALFKPKAFRACARSNAENWIVILIPCHRVIKKTGDLCGYNAGLWRKKWLLNHESTFSKSK